MRLKYYKRVIGQMKYKKPIVLLLFVLVIIVYIAIYFSRDIIPTIKTLCESRARAIATTITNETIQEYIKDIEYSNIMRLNYDKSGKLLTISANITELNNLSANIIYSIQEKLSKIEGTIVSIPMGKLIGLSIFSGYGPSIKIKLVPAGNVEAEFKTEFSSEGINQTKHTVYIEIHTGVTIIAPFSSDVVVSTSTVTVAEMIIIGDIPNNYYSIQGLSSLNNNE